MKLESKKGKHMEVCSKNAVLAFVGDDEKGLNFLEDHWESFNRLALKQDPAAVPIMPDRVKGHGVRIFFDWETLLRWFEYQGHAAVSCEERAREFLNDIVEAAQRLFDMECVRADIPVPV